MDEVEVRTKEIEVNPEKMEYINYAYNEEITYWKKAALSRALNESEGKELVDLESSRVLLIRKEKTEKPVNIGKIIFYLKSTYSTHNKEPRTFIDDILNKEPSFEAMTNYLKTLSKYIKDDKNMSLKTSVYLADGF